MLHSMSTQPLFLGSGLFFGYFFEVGCFFSPALPLTFFNIYIYIYIYFFLRIGCAWNGVLEG